MSQTIDDLTAKLAALEAGVSAATTHKAAIDTKIADLQLQIAAAPSADALAAFAARLDAVIEMVVALGKD